MRSLLLHFDDEQASAARLGAAAGIATHCINRHRFPDGELKLTLPASLPGRVVLFRSLDQPNESHSIREKWSASALWAAFWPACSTP